MALVLILIVIIGLIIYFVLFKNPNQDNSEKEPNETLVIEKDNYKYTDGKLIFLDSEEKEIGTYECINKDDTKCMIKKVDNANDTFDRIKNVDSTGTEIIKNTPIYFNKYVFIEDGEDKLLYDIVNKESIFQIKSVKVYDNKDNLAIIEDTNNRFGLLKISEEGYEYQIRPSYDYLGLINSDINCLLAKDNNNSYIIDFDGKKLSSNIKADIKSVNQDFIVGKVANNYNLYDYKFNELVSEFDYIAFYDNIIALVDANRLYLLNSNLNKLNEDGLRLSNINNLVQVNVYENNKLKEVLAAFNINVKDNKVYVNVQDEIYEVNILEGELSSNYETVSYFDGKLYFYSDNSKNNLIGVYSCTNKNILNKKEDTLNNCYVYKVGESYSSVYNNEYVFIYDNLSNGTNNIYLYDLKTNRVRSTYTDVKILKDNELNNDVKAVYTSLSYIIAKSATGSNAGNYGVLEINSDGIKGLIDFKYKNITKDNGYYVFLNNNNEYSIYNTNFEKISDDFAYVKLYANYYAGVIAGKLNIYRYNNLLSVLSQSIDVPNNEFNVDFTDGFVITVGENVYKFDSNGKEIKEENDKENKPTEEDKEGTEDKEENGE